MLRWSFDETGGVRAMVQMAPPRYQTTVIPIEKSVLFRTSIAKGNPEGVSLLRTPTAPGTSRSGWRSSRRSASSATWPGMPVGKVPCRVPDGQAKGTPQDKTVEAFRKMVRGVRRDENEGLVLPTAVDQDTKQPLFDFELMGSGGTRQFDTNADHHPLRAADPDERAGRLHPGRARGQRLLQPAHRQDRHLPGRAERHRQGHRGHLEPVRGAEAVRCERLEAGRAAAVRAHQRGPSRPGPAGRVHLQHGWCGHAVVPGPGAGEVHPRDRPPARDDATRMSTTSGPCSPSSRPWSTARARWSCSGCSRRPT